MVVGCYCHYNHHLIISIFEHHTWLYRAYYINGLGDTSQELLSWLCDDSITVDNLAHACWALWLWCSVKDMWDRENPGFTVRPILISHYSNSHEVCVLGKLLSFSSISHQLKKKRRKENTHRDGLLWRLSETTCKALGP